MLSIISALDTFLWHTDKRSGPRDICEVIEQKLFCCDIDVFKQMSCFLKERCLMFTSSASTLLPATQPALLSFEKVK